MVKKISQRVQNDISSLLFQGKSTAEVARRFGVGKSTVHRIGQSKKIVLKAKSGRKKILTERQEKFCAKKIISGEAKSVVQITKILETDHKTKVSRKTVARALNKAGLKAGEKKKKPGLSQKNIKARLEFAKNYQDWTENDWNRVIFSDESKINRFNSDGRSWGWFRDTSMLEDRNVNIQIKHGGGGIMIWGCMTSQGVGYLCKIEGNMDQHLYKSILDDDLMNTIDFYDLDMEQVIFQHDNDPKHKAKSVQKWLSEQEFKTLEWPAQSPDLNPIEHLWAEVKRRLNKYDSPPKGVIELWERVQLIWNEISPEVCQNLFNSMARRIQAVIKSKGKWTKY